MTKFVPTDRQERTLIAYAGKHGRTWKSRLQAEWMTAAPAALREIAQVVT